MRLLPQLQRLKLLPSFAYTGDIRVSAKAVSGFVDRVLTATESKRVDLIGWSQGGGPLPNYYITKLGGDKKRSTSSSPLPRRITASGPERLKVRERVHLRGKTQKRSRPPSPKPHRQL
ncbi:triacylglycerol lipase precursor [Cutibacterium acnes JCM 18918]|nr:triacylglycerol lipase precursor [Cutibacterium acnes JCM 18918]